MKSEDAWGVPGARLDEIRIPAGNKYEASLNDEEMAVVDAMRMGADIQVRFAGLETYQEFDEAFACFDNLEGLRPMAIYDMTGTFFSFVSFDREYRKLMVLASINMKGSEKNE